MIGHSKLRHPLTIFFVLEFLDDETTGQKDDQLTDNKNCGNCQRIFSNAGDLKQHSSSCVLRPEEIERDTMVDVSKEEHINEVDEVIKHNQDAVNNNVHSEDAMDRLHRTEDDNGSDAPQRDDSLIATKNSTNTKSHSRDSPLPENDDDDAESNPDLAGTFPQNHVTLEALQNTKVAVAQFAANALAAGAGNGDNEAALKDLAVLHSTLFQLQHQHVFQLQLIQQLQSQLSMNRSKEDEDKEEEMDDQKSHQSEGFSDKREEDEDEDFGKLEPEVIISR